MKLTTIIREKWEKSKWWPVFFWSLFIFVGSSLPPVSIRPDTFLDFFLHKSVHFLEYAVLAYLTWRAVRVFGVSLLFPIFYAFTDEAHQYFVGGRTGRWQDVAWDSFAVVLGNLFIFYFGRLRVRQPDGFGKEGVSTSVDETQQLAKEVLARLGDSNLVALYGDLGSGKTVFVQGLSQALGVRETVNSSSFILVREYSLPEEALRFKKLVHVDLYRLTSGEEAQALLLEELVSDKSNLVVVEWAERWALQPPVPAVKIYFRYLDERRRHWRLEKKEDENSLF